MNKKILIASFIFPERVEWFLNYLKTKFEIEKENVFCYENLDDESKVILTFRLTIENEKPLNLKNLFPNAVIIHKKGDALYTINALNQLIAEKFPESIGNIDNKNVKLDWSEYQNKFILLNNNKLCLFNINRVF
jgi:hypothetical protein